MVTEIIGPLVNFTRRKPFQTYLPVVSPSSDSLIIRFTRTLPQNHAATGPTVSRAHNSVVSSLKPPLRAVRGLACCDQLQLMDRWLDEVRDLDWFFTVARIYDQIQTDCCGAVDPLTRSSSGRNSKPSSAELCSLSSRTGILPVRCLGA